MGNIERGGYILYRRKVSSWKWILSLERKGLNVIEIVSLSCACPLRNGVGTLSSGNRRVNCSSRADRPLHPSHDGSHLQVKSTFDPDWYGHYPLCPLDSNSYIARDFFLKTKDDLFSVPIPTTELKLNSPSLPVMWLIDLAGLIISRDEEEANKPSSWSLSSSHLFGMWMVRIYFAHVLYSRFLPPSSCPPLLPFAVSPRLTEKLPSVNDVVRKRLYIRRRKFARSCDEPHNERRCSSLAPSSLFDISLFLLLGCCYCCYIHILSNPDNIHTSVSDKAPSSMLRWFQPFSFSPSWEGPGRESFNSNVMRRSQKNEWFLFSTDHLLCIALSTASRLYAHDIVLDTTLFSYHHLLSRFPFCSYSSFVLNNRRICKVAPVGMTIFVLFLFKSQYQLLVLLEVASVLLPYYYPTRNFAEFQLFIFGLLTDFCFHDFLSNYPWSKTLLIVKE